MKKVRNNESKVRFTPLIWACQCENNESKVKLPPLFGPEWMRNQNGPKNESEEPKGTILMSAQQASEVRKWLGRSPKLPAGPGISAVYHLKILVNIKSGYDKE